MKIIFVGPAHPYRGGIAEFNNRLALQLRSEGHEVEILNFSLQYPGFLFPGKTQYTSDPAPEGLQITRCVNSCNPFNWIKIGRRLRHSDTDLVIMRYWLPFMGPCLGTIARLSHKKVVAICDNVIPHEHRPGDKLFTRYFLSGCSAFMTLSDAVLKDLSKFDSVKPRVFSPHPLYDNYGTAISKQEACAKIGVNPCGKYILFFGFIRDYKGLDLLMKALPLLGDKEVKLIVAGEFYGNEEKYKALEEELGVKERILWYSEFISDSDVRNFFCAADIVVQPYKSATQSGVTQIGYHFEKPMIVTNVGGLGEIVPDGQCGYVVEPEPREIAAAIDRFFAETPDFSEKIKAQKQKYSWATFTKNLLTL